MNLGETPVQLIVTPVQDHHSDVEHINCSQLDLSSLCTKGMKPSEEYTAVINKGQCMTYEAIRYVYGSSTLGLGVLTKG